MPHECGWDVVNRSGGQHFGERTGRGDAVALREVHAEALDAFQGWGRVDTLGVEIVAVGGVSRRCPTVDPISGNALA